MISWPSGVYTGDESYTLTFQVRTPRQTDEHKLAATKSPSPADMKVKIKTNCGSRDIGFQPRKDLSRFEKCHVEIIQIQNLKEEFHK